MTGKEMSFWDHIDEFRSLAIRIIICLLVVTPIVFFCKDLLFSIILAPSKSDFVIYQLFCDLGNSKWYMNISAWLESMINTPLPDTCPKDVHVSLINTKLASQFLIHITTSIYASLIITTPYIIYQIYGFIAPALYDNERKHSFFILASACILFLSGVLLNYFLIFPLSFRFLATYQVAEEIANMIALQSYISSFVTLSLLMGIVFEIPILTMMLAKFGFVSANLLKKFRKHAFVGTMIIAAAITPTGDIVTLMLVTIPMYLLYEFSIHIIK